MKAKCMWVVYQVSFGVTERSGIFTTEKKAKENAELINKTNSTFGVWSVVKVPVIS